MINLIIKRVNFDSSLLKKQMLARRYLRRHSKPNILLCWLIIKSRHVSPYILVLVLRVHNVYGWSVSDNNSQLTPAPTGSLYGCYDVRTVVRGATIRASLKHSANILCYTEHVGFNTWVRQFLNRFNNFVETRGHSILDDFAKLRRTTVSFVMSVLPSVRSSTRKSLDPNGRNVIKFVNLSFLRKSVTRMTDILYE
jgi:hypothetical protein